MDWIRAVSAAERGRSGTSAKVGNNTWMELDEERNAHLRLHQTRILTWKPDGSMVLNSGGWRTVTTKERLNSYLPSPWGVFSERGVWYVSRGEGGEWVFEDGMILMPDGTVQGAGLREKNQDRETERLKKRLREYTRAFLDALEAGNVPAPSGADCWYCALADKDGKTMGEHGDQRDHLLSHLDERYFVPSLLARAIRVFPVSECARNYIASWWDPSAPAEARESVRTWSREIARQQIGASLYRYLGRGFGFCLTHGPGGCRGV